MPARKAHHSTTFLYKPSSATAESHRNYLAEAQHISEALLQEQAGIRTADKLLYQAKEVRNQCVTAEFTAEDK